MIYIGNTKYALCYQKEDNTNLIGLIERNQTHLDIPMGTTQIGINAFLGYSTLTSLTIPEGVTKICQSGIRECSGLTLLDLPSTITSIENFAFYADVNIDIIISRRTTPPTVGSAVFGNGATTYVGKNSSVKKLYVPYGCTAAYQTGNWLNDLLNSSKCNFTIAELDENGNIPT